MKHDGAKTERVKRLGRGLADVSHVFLSGTSDERADAAEPSDFWLPERRLIAITSGKGVRGKTLVAFGLAHGLAEKGRRVALFTDDEALLSDAKLSPPAGGEPKGKGPHSLSIFELSPLLTVLEDGVDVNQLERAADGYDVVVVEVTPQISSETLIWKLARLIIVIAEPGTRQMQAAYAMIKRLATSRAGCRIGLVVNLARDYDEAERCFRKISRACREFLKVNVRNYGYVALSDEVVRVLAGGKQPSYVWSNPLIARCFESIVRIYLIDDRAVRRRRKEVKQKSCV